MRYLWWSGFGAFLGGWMSALLAWYAILAPVRHSFAFAVGSGVAALAHHAHELVLAGLLIGAASGVCLGRCLALRPVRKKHPAALTLAALLVVMSLPWLDIFSGSVAGLQIAGHGVMILTMDVVGPDQNLVVPVGQGIWACGPRGGCLYQSYQDRAVVVTLCYRCLFYPWR